VAVAKCALCRATVTVIFADGAATTSHGASFRTRCKERTAGAGEPAQCPNMSTAIASASARAARGYPARPVA
jgi:hypothetical protein